MQYKDFFQYNLTNQPLGVLDENNYSSTLQICIEHSVVSGKIRTGGFRSYREVVVFCDVLVCMTLCDLGLLGVFQPLGGQV